MIECAWRCLWRASCAVHLGPTRFPLTRPGFPSVRRPPPITSYTPASQTFKAPPAGVSTSKVFPIYWRPGQVHRAAGLVSLACPTGECGQVVRAHPPHFFSQRGPLPPLVFSFFCFCIYIFFRKHSKHKPIKHLRFQNHGAVRKAPLEGPRHPGKGRLSLHLTRRLKDTTLSQDDHHSTTFLHPPVGLCSVSKNLRCRYSMLRLVDGWTLTHPPFLRTCLPINRHNILSGWMISHSPLPPLHHTMRHPFCFRILIHGYHRRIYPQWQQQSEMGTSI